MIDSLVHSPIAINGTIAGHSIDDIGQVRDWTYQQRTWEPAALTLRLDLSHHQVDSALNNGNAAKLTLNQSYQFHGHVVNSSWSQDASGQCHVTVTLADQLAALTNQQHMRLFQNKSTKDIAQIICRSYGLSCEGSKGPQWRQMYQTKQSDLDFLIDICHRSSIGFHLDGSRLCLYDIHKTASLQTSYAAQNCQHITVEHSAIGQAHTIQSQAWDFVEQHDWHGKSATQSAGNGTRSVPGLVAENNAQLDALSNGLLTQKYFHNNYVAITLGGFPQITLGGGFKLMGARGVNADTLRCTQIQITNNSRIGLQHQISNQLPDIKRPTRESFLCSATVCDLADPKKRGRIRVRFSCFDDMESTWLPVISPGAGKNRGIFALPDRNDCVAVLVANQDLGQAVVIGGLLDVQAPKHGGIRGNKLEQFHIQSPGGHKITLDAHDASILIEHAKGSSIKMNKNNMEVTSKGNLSISAPGKSLTFTAKKIDFKQG